MALVTDLQERTDAELLGLMAGHRDAPDPAREAWGELFERHKHYLYGASAHAFYPFFRDEDRIADIVACTFQRAFNWAARRGDPATVIERFSDADPDAARRRVRGWLSRIAERLFRDAVRAHLKRSWEHLLPLDNVAAGEPEGAQSAWQARVREAVDRLTPSEADALRLSIPYYNADTGKFEIPRGKATLLAESLRTSAVNLRQLRFRALRKLGAVLRNQGFPLVTTEDRNA